MILRAETRSGSQVVVKLLHFLFQEIRPIAESMVSHHQRIEAIRADCGYLTHCFGSGSGWLIEEYVDGSTLESFVQEKSKSIDSYEGRIELFRRTYCAVLAAVASLHRASGGTATHADLSPSNIMVQTGGLFPGEVSEDADEGKTVRVRLIDLGRNLLASSAIGRVSSPDAHFVAPEVATLSPEGRAEDQRADYYSLGLLVPLCLGVSSSQDLLGDRLPDELFVLEPILATVATDLADPIPGRRFGLLGEPSLSSSENLHRLRTDLLLVTNALSDGTGPTVATGAKGALPAGGAAIRLGAFEIFRSVTRAAKAFRGSELPLAREHARFRAWLAVALAFLSLSLLVLVQTFSLDYPDDFDFLTLPFAKRLLVDKAGYTVDQRMNWQARMIGCSFAVACFYYYVYGFSRYTLRRAGSGGYFRVGEWSVRSMTFVVFPFVVLGNIWYPGMWLWFSVIGMGVVGFNNWIVSVQVRSIVTKCRIVAAAEANLLPTRSSSYWGGVRESVILKYWAPSLGLYVVIITVLASSVTWFAASGDTLWLAVVLAMLNFAFFAWAQAIRQGPQLHGEVARAAVFGERIAEVVHRTP